MPWFRGGGVLSGVLLFDQKRWKPCHWHDSHKQRDTLLATCQSGVAVLLLLAFRAAPCCQIFLPVLLSLYSKGVIVTMSNLP